MLYYYRRKRMPSSHVSSSVRPGALIDGRYTVDRALGRGGMGTVYAVNDVSTGRRLALKWLKRDVAENQAAAAVLFQREYHTLAHLRHPRVIQVYDYGLGEGRPYYTMELLDGADLRELAPMPWPRACAVLRDVASSLALLHSRRLLHRDLSARNVRCTRDGQAKLIDFGTMTPMGVAKDVAGTPPYMAPEAVHGQELDARTDLFSLGALAYWALTGHDAYPARDTRELRRLWQRPVMAPSAVVPGIPDALDAVVLSLLSFDVHARPGSAAEVIERLTAIADLHPIEQLDVARAYLSTPTLIGHSETVARFHKRLVRAARGRGSALFVVGRPGLGRSRLLHTFVLEAKLGGVLTLTADAEDAKRGELGVARRLLEGLVESAPELALETFPPYADALGDMLPALRSRLSTPPGPEPADRRERLVQTSAAVRDWLRRVSQRRPLMIVVDDVDRADDASQVSLALLAGDALNNKWVVAVSSAPEAVPRLRALRALESSAARVELRPMDSEHTLELLRSVFGDVPNLRAVAGWAHTLAQGNPRTLMELSQHLVDQGIARYERGRWSLPESMAEHRLPASVEQALDQLVASLGSPARALAEMMSLVTERGHLEFDEIVEAAGGAAHIRNTYAAIDELVASQVLVSVGTRYHVRHRGLILAVQRGMREERRRVLHLKLSLVYQRRQGDGVPASPENTSLIAYHAYRGGDLDWAISALRHARPDPTNHFARTREAIEMMEACLDHAGSLSLSPREIFPLRRALVVLSESSDAKFIQHADALLEQLWHDSGLCYFDEFDDESEETRARRAVAHAKEVHAMAPEEERGLSPTAALFELGAAALSLASTYASRNDLGALARLPRFLSPARTLSPSLDLVYEIVGQAVDALSGLSTTDRRRALLARLEGPFPDLEDTVREGLRHLTMYWLALEEAAAGQESALDWASKLDSTVAYRGMAWQIRTVYHLFRGHEWEAEEARRRRERLALEGRFVDVTSSRGALSEMEGHHRCGDLIGVRQMLEVISDLAERHPGWQREELITRGRYALLRGEAWAALAAFERADDVLGQAEALLDLGKAAQVINMLDSRVPPSLVERLSPIYRWPLELCRVRALARSGEPAAAALHLSHVTEQADAAGLRGVLRYLLHEARARIAIDMDDPDEFRPQIRRLGRMAESRATALRARYDQISGEARRALFSIPPEPSHVTDSTRSDMSDVRTLLDATLTPARRVEHALRLLVKQTGASQAFLFGMQENGLRFSASLDDERPPDGLSDMLGFYLSAELNEEDDPPRTVTGTFDVASDMVAFINDGHRVYYPVLLTSSHAERRVVAGIAVLGIPFQREPDLPPDVIAQITDALLEAGDVVGVDAAD